MQTLARMIIHQPKRVTTMTYKQIQIIELVKSAGQEAAEDMLVCMGWVADHKAAKAMIKKAQAAQNNPK